MPCLLEVALPAIAAELQSGDGGSGQTGNGRQLDVFVTDLCPHRENGLVEIVTPLFTWSPPLLRAGALVVLTFKALKGHSERSWAAQAQAQADHLSGFLVGTRLLHLMANRKGERTLVGFVK